MTAFPFAVLNEGALSDDEVAAFCAAQEEKTATYMLPFYPDVKGTTVVPVKQGSAPPANTVPVLLVPNAAVARSLGYDEIAGTLGYHQTQPSGVPVAIVELDACTAAGIPWTVAASHEIDEAGQNPFLDRFVTVGSRTYPFETDDPVTSDQMELPNHPGVALANAVTPAFYDVNSPATARFDLMEENLHQSIAAGPPPNGWLEWSENGQWANGWGADLSPEHIAYLRNRPGRRWRMRGRLYL